MSYYKTTQKLNQEFGLTCVCKKKMKAVGPFVESFPDAVLKYVISESI